MDPLVKSTLHTKYGTFQVRAYKYQVDDLPNLVLHTDCLDVSEPVYVRIHSECMTGDVFGSAKCDCGEQLEYSMKWVQKHGGAIVYLRQEGRGIGLINKLKAYNLQNEGFDTKDANLELGFHEDSREYTPALEILRDLGINRIRLLTNNPEKISAFVDTDIEVVERVSIEIVPQSYNLGYLQTKKHRMGHLLNLKTIG
ncbi:MAG: GTP cyclohydrolase II [Bacteroidota bacterium]